MILLLIRDLNIQLLHTQVGIYTLSHVYVIMFLFVNIMLISCTFTCVFFDIHNLHNIIWLYYVGSDHKVKRSLKKKLATAAPPISSMLQCVMIYYYII